MAIAPPVRPVIDEAWLKTALDAAAFPYDGAKYEGGEAHDPSIALFGDAYLMITTSGHELAPLSTSTDLTAWRRHGSILPDQPEWLKKAIPNHRSVWAPAPLKVGKKLRVYYCASERFGANTSYIAFAECAEFNPAKPTEGWTDKGLLIQSKADESNFNAIDPDVLIDEDGRHWMVYGSYWSGMYQVELDPVTGGLKDPKAKPLHVASNSERGNPLEAPAMFCHDGYYYLGVTYGLAAQGIRSTYRMVCGRSKSPEGPFLGYDGKPMTEGGHTTLLKSSPPMFGPGGGNFFRDAKGDLWMAYHYYDGRRHWNRDLWGAPTLQIRRIVWGADGWPLPGLPAGLSLENANGKMEGVWQVQVDFGAVREMELLEGGKTRQGEREGTWKVEGDVLRLIWPQSEAPNGAWVDALTLDSSRHFAVGRNQSGAIVRAIHRDAKAAR